MGVQVATQLGFEMRPIHLKAHERVVGLKPEKRARRTKDGTHLVYLCEDRHGAVILTAKLTTLADYLSAISGPLKQDQINHSSLYKSLTIKDGEGKTGGWAKHRWRVRALPIDGAVEAFEELRGSYETAVVLGSERCVSTAAAA